VESEQKKALDLKQLTKATEKATAQAEKQIEVAPQNWTVV